MRDRVHVWGAAMALVIAIGTLLSGAPLARAASSAGTNFWLGFPDAFQETTPQFVLELTGTASAHGTVSVPGDQYSQSFSVTPGKSTNIAVPLSSEDTTNDAVETGHGIHVLASAPVTVDVMYEAETDGLSDGYLGLPTTALGTGYLVAAVPADVDCAPSGQSEFEIVATQASTTVTITPSAVIGAHASGTAYTEQLGAGSTYLGQASGGDLTGTRIVATKPVAILAGNNCGEVPSGTLFANALMEEEPPISQWGTAFFTLPFATRTTGEYTIVASQANTTVEQNGTSLATIGSAGAALTQIITTASHITANKPILVEHMAVGSEYPDPNGDPTMITVPPASEYTRIQTVTTPSGFAPNYLNLSIAKADIKTLTLDGKHVSASLFTAVGNSTTESGAQIAVNAGSHTLVAAGPFGVEAYGFNPASTDAYGFPGAFGAPTRAAAPLITITRPVTGATYKKGQAVRAAYRCTAAFGTTITSCAGSVANGALIATSTVGRHSFVVRAHDGYGNQATRTVTYRVVRASG
jgi:hypothetical protein